MTATPNDAALTVAPEAPKRKTLPVKVVKLLKYQRTAAKLGRARKRKTAVEALVKRLDKELAETMGEAADSLASPEGTVFAKRQYQTRRNINMDALAARFPEAYAATLSVTQSSWIKTL